MMKMRLKSSVHSGPVQEWMASRRNAGCRQDFRLASKAHAAIIGLAALGLAQPAIAQPVPGKGSLEFIFADVAYEAGNRPPDPQSGDYWLKAIVSQVDPVSDPSKPGKLIISLQANLRANPAAYIESVAFNLDPFAQAAGLRCADSPGICQGSGSKKPAPSEWGYKFSKNKIDLPNRASGFDFQILLPNSNSANRLTGSELFNIEVDGLSLSSFNAPNEGKANSIKGLFAAAKLNGYGGSATLLDGPSDPVPGPLPLLGALAAFQASRRLRRRLLGVPVVAPRSA